MVLVFYYYCILCYAAATTRQRATQERMRREFLSQTDKAALAKREHEIHGVHHMRLRQSGSSRVAI